MILIGTVQQVVCNDVQFCHLPAKNLYVRTRREVQERIAWRWCLRIVSTVNMTLLQVTFYACRDIEVVE